VLEKRRPTLALIAALSAACLDGQSPIYAQTDAGTDTLTIRGDRLSGIVLPVLPLQGAIVIAARQGSVWTVDDTKRLFLRDDVQITVAGYAYTASSAVVWINRLPTSEGPVNQIAIWFPELDNPGAPVGLGAAGRHLLVTGSTRGDVTLTLDLVREGRPDHDALREAEQQLRLHLQRLVTTPPPLDRRPRIVERQAPRAPGEDLVTTVDVPAAPRQTPWLREPGASLSYSAARVDLATGPEENVVTATGSIIIEYMAADRTARPAGDLTEPAQLTLVAEKAVIFAEPGQLSELAERTLDASMVRGVYLEGNVLISVNDGAYTARAPRVYYDFDAGRAIMVEAVLRTTARDGELPVTARARELRQVAADQWEGRDVRVAASEFYTGHFSIGARSMSIGRPADASGRTDDLVLDARGIDLRAGDVPFFWWPHYKGTIAQTPLRGASITSRDNLGVALETKWNLFSLIGSRPLPGEAELSLDAYTERGPGVGLDYRFDAGATRGVLDLYYVHDSGTDKVVTGREVVPENENRGAALYEQQFDFSRELTLQLQGAVISDPTWMPSWREDDYEMRREFETSAYLKHQSDRGAITLLSKYDFNEFLANGWQLASQGYTVNRLPELTWRRYGDTLFGDALTYSGETRLTRARLSYDRSTPRELGVRGRALGILEDEKVADSLLDEGYPEHHVLRGDTRHELSWPLSWGPIEITPFGVVRLTGYDDDFEEFSSDADSARVYGSLGLRAETRFQRVDDSIESRLFGLHRLRHIVAPSVTLWHAEATVDEGDLPVIDPDVESILSGGAVRLGVRNTIQTQRGGPGRWHSVNVFDLDTAVVLHSGEVERDSPSPQYFAYRPEYSHPGDHFRAIGRWQVSDAFSLASDATWDLDQHEFARYSAGGELRHTDHLLTYAEYRVLEASDSRLLGVGWRYRLTPTYLILISPSWDMTEDRFRALRLQVTRSFPDFDFTLGVRYDDIRDDTVLSASMDVTTF